MRQLPPDLYTCAKCRIQMIFAFRTNHEGVVLCGFCVGHGPDDPPMHRPALFNPASGAVIRYTPDDLPWLVGPAGNLIPLRSRYERTA